MSESPSPALIIPFTGPRTLDTLEQTHLRVRVTPEHDPLLAYSLAIPKTWAYSKQFGPVPSGLFTTQGLGFFTASVEPGAPVIAVTKTSFPFEVPIDTWLRLTLVAEGWTIIAARWFPGAAGLFFDAVATRVFNGVPEVRRTSVRVDGSNILAVNCLCARVHWEAAKEIFWIALSTFKLQGGTGTTQMEPWSSMAGENPHFEIGYPVSWSATPVEASADRVSALDIRLLDRKHETLLAYLQIKVEALPDGQQPPDLDALRARALAKLTGAGFVATGPQPSTTEEDDPRAEAEEGWLGGFVGRGHLGTADVDVRLGFLHRSGAMASMSMISPLLADDVLVVLRAQRAFEIVRATLTVG